VPRFIDRLLGRGPVLSHALKSQGPQFAVDRSDIDPAIIGLSSWADVVTAPGRVSRSEAIQSPAVKRSRDLIAGTIGQLPLDVYDASKREQDNGLLKQPERNRPRSVTMAQTVDDILFEGKAFWRVTERYANKFPAYVELVHPDRVDDTQHPVLIDGKPVEDIDLIRFDSPNDPLLRAGARAIRTALQLEAAAYRSALSPMAQGLFTPVDGDDEHEDDEVRKFLADWRNARQQNSDGYVPAWVKYNPLSWSPEQLQMNAARERANAEIATLAGINSEDVNVSTTSRTYFNSWDIRKRFLDFTLGPYMQAIEDRLSMGDVTARGQYAKFNVNAFLETDTLSRYQTYEVGKRVGAITGREIRELEDKPPLTPQEEAAVGSTTTAAPAASRQSEPASQFSSDQEVVTFDAPAAAAEFKVDLDKRTIRGLAVPYGQTAQSNGRTWQFSKGSLAYEDVSRVKLLDGHDWTKPIGRAVQLDDTDAGLVATFKVAATPAGDEALLMASDLVKDGLSIGIADGGEFDERDGVLHAVSAPLAHVALTPCPAFDSARVTAVAASKHNEENPVTDTKVSTEAKTEEVTAPNFGNVAEQIAALLIKGTHADGSGPEAVSPTAQFEVKEEAPYRFDGGRGEHEFSSDLFAVARHDNGSGDAKVRLDKFMSATFDVTTTNVASVNPNRQRPDLFVDQLSYVTPVWDAINKGTLPDGTPFVVPKWNSETTLVGDHTPGSEPSEGGYTTTSQTITPGALSGKYDVYREVVDAGGNPQVSGLIWRGVLRAYFESLEAKAVALLDSLTPTAIALTTAAADDALAGEIEAGFAALHFVRGGDRFDKLVLQEDLYKALVAARDADGRPLYPILGAVNSNGQTASDMGSIRVGGKVGLPAWALGASGTVSESSYLFSSDDVHGWATPPQQLRFEYQVATITFGVWGYQATANTRLAGVREITYDPAA
jgi:HK97 family phage prohead protease